MLGMLGNFVKSWVSTCGHHCKMMWNDLIIDHHKKCMHDPHAILCGQLDLITTIRLMGVILRQISGVNKGII